MAKSAETKRQQMSLFGAGLEVRPVIAADVVVPEEYIQHFNRTGRCLHCHWGLNHHFHAVNHYRRLHVPKPASKNQKFYTMSLALDGHLIAQEVSYAAYVTARQERRPTAYTKVKPRSRRRKNG